jgi:hypothetical protein
MFWKWLTIQKLLDDLFDQHWCAPCVADNTAFAYEEALAGHED